MHALRLDPATRDRLIEDNVPLAVHLSGRYPVAGYEPADLASESCVALVRAADSYDPGVGAPFPAYASLCIVRRIRHLRQAAKATKRRAEVAGGDSVDWLADPRPADDPDAPAVIAALLRALEQLPERHREVVCLHYGIDDRGPLSLREIAGFYGVSKERAWRIERVATVRLREAMGRVFG